LKPFVKPEPLTEAELDRLGDFLDCCEGGKAMNVEQLDGFFAALIAGPDVVMPSEYNREVFGGEMSDACEFANLDEAKEILGLLTRHWNTIAGALLKGEGYLPLLLKDDKGIADANDWARGFMRGMNMRHDGWAELVNDEKHCGYLVPMFVLYHEHDEDPKMRLKPISPQQRDEVILHMAAGVVGAYRYFREQQRADAGADSRERGSSTSKVGRNELCPCGSGKKYKKWRGSATVN